MKTAAKGMQMSKATNSIGNANNNKRAQKSKRNSHRWREACCRKHPTSLSKTRRRPTERPVARKYEMEGPLQPGNVDMLAGSPARPRPGNATTAWHDIDWATVHRRVRKLQARKRQGCQSRLLASGPPLTTSAGPQLLGQMFAVLRVTENRGGKTPGVDGVIWNTPEAKSDAVSALGKRDYRPQPLRRIYIPKSNGKKRPLSIPVMADRGCQALHRLGGPSHSGG